MAPGGRYKWNTRAKVCGGEGVKGLGLNMQCQLEVLEAAVTPELHHGYISAARLLVRHVKQ